MKIDLLIQLKLRNQILQEIIQGVRTLPDDIPTNLERYRTWESEKLGIMPIGSKASVSQRAQKGREDVLHELGLGETLRARCLALKGGRPGGKRLPLRQQTAKYQQESEQALADRDKLAAENHELQAAIERLKSELSTAARNHAALLQRVDELAYELNTRRLKLVAKSSERTPNGK